MGVSPGGERWDGYRLVSQSGEAPCPRFYTPILTPPAGSHAGRLRIRERTPLLVKRARMLPGAGSAELRRSASVRAPLGATRNNTPGAGGRSSSQARGSRDLVRIALFAESYRPVINGAAVAVDLLAQALGERGHEVKAPGQLKGAGRCGRLGWGRGWCKDWCVKTRAGCFP